MIQREGENEQIEEVGDGVGDKEFIRLNLRTGTLGVILNFSQEPHLIQSGRCNEISLKITHNLWHQVQKRFEIDLHGFDYRLV